MNPPACALSLPPPARLGKVRSSGRCTPARHSRSRNPDTGASTVNTSPPPVAVCRRPLHQFRGPGPVAEDVDLHPAGSDLARRGHILEDRVANDDRMVSTPT